jgi:predicted nucleotidyltransferase
VNAEPLRLRELLDRLASAQIDFVVVGGLAVNAWGYLRGTRDVDLVPDPAAPNLEKLDSVLRELDGKVDVGGQLLEASAIRTFLWAGDRTLVATELGLVDVLQGLPQVPPFATLAEAAIEIEMDGISIRVCSLEHLLQMKRASDRPRDRDDLEELEEAQGRNPASGD